MTLVEQYCVVGYGLRFQGPKHSVHNFGRPNYKSQCKW